MKKIILLLLLLTPCFARTENSDCYNEGLKEGKRLQYCKMMKIYLDGDKKLVKAMQALVDEGNQFAIPQLKDAEEEVQSDLEYIQKCHCDK